MGHGNWNGYYAKIQELAMRKPAWPFTCYDWTISNIGVDNVPPCLSTSNMAASVKAGEGPDLTTKEAGPLPLRS